jgi:hypothetical protein
MASIIIRGTRIKEATMYCSQSGQLTVDYVCRASWTDTVCEAFGWQKEPNGFGNGSLDGKLAAITMKLEPAAKTLKDYAFELAINSVHGFKHRAKTEDDTVTKRELEFTVTTVAEDAAMVLSRYIQHCGPADDAGQAKIQYSPETQMEIGEEAEGSEADGKRRGRKRDQAVQ